MSLLLTLEKTSTAIMSFFLTAATCTHSSTDWKRAPALAMICLELVKGILNHMLVSQVTAPFYKLCTDFKLYSMAIGNNYGERRTQCANNHYHVRQQYEVIAYSLCCLLPIPIAWGLEQSPIISEGHKQVKEFQFNGCLMYGQAAPNKKTTVRHYEQPILLWNKQHEWVLSPLEIPLPRANQMRRS